MFRPRDSFNFFNMMKITVFEMIQNLKRVPIIEEFRGIGDTITQIDAA